MILPCIALTLTIYIINVFCDRLRDTLDPKAAGSSKDATSAPRPGNARRVPDLPKTGVAAIQGLRLSIPTKDGAIDLLEDVSLTLRANECTALVGESGSGKSTIGKAVLRLLEIDAGKIVFNGHDLHKIGKTALRHLRKDMQIIFQDPYASHDPRKIIRATLAEALDTHGLHLGPARGARMNFPAGSANASASPAP